jgi:hypothetical protein
LEAVGALGDAILQALVAEFATEMLLVLPRTVNSASPSSSAPGQGTDSSFSFDPTRCTTLEGSSVDKHIAASPSVLEEGSHNQQPLSPCSSETTKAATTTSPPKKSPPRRLRPMVKPNFTRSQKVAASEPLEARSPGPQWARVV